jgi:hypothetical protein
MIFTIGYAYLIMANLYVAHHHQYSYRYHLVHHFPVVVRWYRQSVASLQAAIQDFLEFRNMYSQK